MLERYNMLLDATQATHYFYAILFAGSFMALFVGLRMLLRASEARDEEMRRRAKFILLFSVIALVCIGIVSYFLTGSVPLN